MNRDELKRHLWDTIVMQAVALCLWALVAHSHNAYRDDRNRRNAAYLREALAERFVVADGVAPRHAEGVVTSTSRGFVIVAVPGRGQAGILADSPRLAELQIGDIVDTYWRDDGETGFIGLQRIDR